MEREKIKILFEQSAAGGEFPGGDPETLRLRVLAADALQPLLAEIRSSADALLEESTPALTYSLFRLYGETGSRMEYDRVYFERRKRLTTFGLMAWLDPENSGYRQALHDILWSVCEEYTWCLTAHLSGHPETDESMTPPMIQTNDIDFNATIDLFAAETAFALTEIAKLQGEALPKLIRKRIQNEVLRRVLRPFASRQRTYHWERATNNWSSVCAGSIGATALHLLEDKDELAAVLSDLLPAIESFLSGYADDGACTEGYGYWQYGFGYYVYFADLLKWKTSGAIDLFKADKVRQIAMFQQKAFLDGRHTVNFSDAFHETGIYMGLAHYLNAQFDGVDAPRLDLQAAYSADHCGRWAPAFRNLIWFNDQADAKDWKPATYYLKDAQWLISRYETSSGRFVFAAKGGHNAEPHNHNDIGHFIVHARGTTLLADMGCGLYTREYFGANRYGILCNASAGHSVPIVNGTYQSPGANRKAHVVDVQFNEEVATFTMEMAAAYEEPSMKSLRRSFTWRRAENPVLVLEDTFSFDRVCESVVERLITPVKPTLHDDYMELASGQAFVKIRYDQLQLVPGITELTNIDHFGNPGTYYALDFRVAKPEVTVKVSLTFEFMG